MDDVLFDDGRLATVERSVTRARATIDEGELDALLEEACPLAFRVALAVLRHTEDAEDVAQEALLRAHRRFSTLRAPERFRPWLVRTTFRLALDRQRGARRRRRREDAASLESTGEEVAREPSAEGDMARRELQQHVWQAIDALPEKLRIVTILVAIDDHQVADVARLLGLPEGTVKSRLFLGRRKLAESLRWFAKGS
jgi:RNA polymerase sigma-70 factor (ECF subfamily)